MSSPAVIIKSKFVISGSKEFKGFVEYIDRDEAKLNLDVINYDGESEFQVYHTFMDYMGDEEKKGSLFTLEDDFLTNHQKSEMKKSFSDAEKNNSPMWQDVISFDNQWLEEQGVYNTKDKTLDESKMKSIVRKTMEEMIRLEKFQQPLWTASFHFNTDNIHVHIATVDEDPSHRERVTVFDEDKQEEVWQYRAKRKQNTIDRMKSVVVGGLIDRNKEYEKIDDLLRNPARKKKNVHMLNNEDTKDLFLKAIELMPDDLKQWRYGYASVDEARPFIDKITEIYLETYHKDEMKELEEKLDEQVSINKELYGEGSSSEKYKVNKLSELKSAMGNAVITEMREYQKGSRISSNGQKVKKVHESYHEKFWRMQQQNSVHVALMELNFRMRKSFHEHKIDKNIAEFDRMMDGYE